MWNRDRSIGKWCPENDGAYRAEQTAIHQQYTDMARSIVAPIDVSYDEAFNLCYAQFAEYGAEHLSFIVREVQRINKSPK
jgi:hypothetical protein